MTQPVSESGDLHAGNFRHGVASVAYLEQFGKGDSVVPRLPCLWPPWFDKT